MLGKFAITAVVSGVLLNAVGGELGDYTISYSYKFLSDARRAGTLSTVNKLPGAVSFTLDPRLILHAGSDTYKHARLLKNPGREGLGDTTVGATARLLMDASKLALSFDYTAKLPTGDSSKRLSSGQVDHSFTATFDRDLTSKLSLEVELADYIAGQGQGKALHYFTPDMTVAYAFDDRNSLEVEVDATPAAHGDPTDISAIVRYVRPVGNRFQMTAGLQAGLTPYNSKIGVVVRFRFKGSLQGER